MKNQSLILKMLGVAFVAILAWALYDISDQIFGYYRDRYYSNEAEVEVGRYIYQALPYLLLLAFFVQVVSPITSCAPMSLPASIASSVALK